MWINWIFRCICNYYDFTTPINSKCCSICYRLAVIPMSSYCPQLEPPIVWGVRVDVWVENSSNRNVDPHCYSASVHTIRLPCTVWPQYTKQLTACAPWSNVFNRWRWVEDWNLWAFFLVYFLTILSNMPVGQIECTGSNFKMGASCPFHPIK